MYDYKFMTKVVNKANFFLTFSFTTKYTETQSKRASCKGAYMPCNGKSYPTKCMHHNQEIEACHNPKDIT